MRALAILTRFRKAARLRRKRIGITRKSIFLSRAFSSMVDGHSSVSGALSALLVELVDVISGLGFGSVGCWLVKGLAYKHLEYLRLTSSISS